MLSMSQMTGFNVGGEHDPYWDNVVLLMHMDGANSGTAFLDSKSRHSLTAVGDAVTTTSDYKFAPSSGDFSTSGSRVTCSDNITDFSFPTGTAFTIEFFINKTAYSDTAWVMSLQESGYSIVDWSILVLMSGALEFGISGGSYLDSTSNLSVGWNHVALVREPSGTLTWFINGVAAGTRSLNVDIGTGTFINLFAIGDRVTSTPPPLQGYLDELRITKGVARYTADFTPTPASFPNS